MKSAFRRAATFGALGICFGLASCAPGTMTPKAMTSEMMMSAPPQTETTGELEQVAAFTGQMPTGVTVSQGGRVFVNFPRWGDEVAFTVAEVVDGEVVPYPNADITALDLTAAADTFVSVQ